MDLILNQELKHIHVDVPNFRQSYFCVESLDRTAASVLEKCRQGDDPLFSDGWAGWPQVSEEHLVLSWFSDLNDRLALLAKDVNPALFSQPSQRLRTEPNKPITGSVAKREMDMGYVGAMDDEGVTDQLYHWSHVRVVGEIKKSPHKDSRSGSWLDVARYAREVLAAQDDRRFVLGFTLCGSLMRLWAFDCLGGIASKRFDVNDDPLDLVTTVLGFLMMNKAQLGYDPTIVRSGTQRYIGIERDGRPERLILEKVIFRQACIAGRATTCWKARRAVEESDDKRTFVIKDAWHFPERTEEGLMLKEASMKGVENLADYYHHETVKVGGVLDDIRGNVRRGLDITAAVVSLPADSEKSSPTASVQGSSSNSPIPGQRETPAGGSRVGQSSNARNRRKRPISRVDSLLPRKKRSSQSTQTSRNIEPENRVHQRLVTQSYGKPIYQASSLGALLAGLEGCINGHESLRRQAGLLHRDISINNLMINEEEDEPSRRAFLIDLDLAVQETRTSASGANQKTGTRAFMAIGVLLGDQHSFMHDLESFFWVLYWICVHYSGPGSSLGATRFYEEWNYMSDSKLAMRKAGLVTGDRVFLQMMESHVTPYYRPLVPWVNRLRRAVFPGGEPWMDPDEGLYERMKTILRDARETLAKAVPDDDVHEEAS
ncbi:hypothetical protein A9Z42_0038400 [Trichoderma parareesei]|uniref:non-specific serine/threonine protein kinase n=1 Tax=Trichoderma parareesei TaxID=858221 RepID=A0A2H2ZJL7_TRIPA|nr:hypothetical protein A9Z42_0038400 [Trichoderma parareesei]